MMHLTLSIASWNSILREYVKQGKGETALRLFRQMEEEGIRVDSRTFAIAMQACCSITRRHHGDNCFFLLEIGKALHADSLRRGFSSDFLMGAILLTICRKCRSIREAEHVFGMLPARDVVSWTCMLCMYHELGHVHTVIHMFYRMLGDGIHPNQRTFLVSLQACCSLTEKEGEGIGVKEILELGQALHQDALRYGCVDVFVSCVLIRLYGKCCHIMDSERVFSEIPLRDVVSWNALIFSYVDVGEGKKALQLYSSMLCEEGIGPNTLTFVATLQACCAVGEEKVSISTEQANKVIALEIGKALHSDAETHGFTSDAFVISMLLRLYSKCGSIIEAEIIFSHHEPNTVLCNVMLSGYIDHSRWDGVSFLLKQMQERGITMSDITFGCILRACSETGSVQMCMQAHFGIIAGNVLCPTLCTSLIHAYGSSNNMGEARVVFDGISHPDNVSWNALNVGNAWEGDFIASLQTFVAMYLGGTRLDDASFLCLLFVCSHNGLIHRALEYCGFMRRNFGTIFDVKHFVSMIDLFGRAGDVVRVEKMLHGMQSTNGLAAWICLLRACRDSGHVQLAKQVFDNALSIEKDVSSLYVLMSNICADAGFCDHILELELMPDKNKQVMDGKMTSFMIKPEKEQC